MARYLIRRLLQLAVVAFIISVLVFLLVHLLPGDPASVILGPNDNPHNRAVLYKQLGLNKPLIQQYFTWLTSVFHGNLGESYLNHELLPRSSRPGGRSTSNSSSSPRSLLSPWPSPWP